MGLIRLLLALAVVVSHSSPVFGLRLLPADLAVQAFYVISGFYMALVLSGKYPATFRGTTLFYQNRYLRLAPVYWIIFSLSLLIALRKKSLPNLGMPQFIETLTTLPLIQSLFVVLSNLFIFGLDLLFFFFKKAS